MWHRCLLMDPHTRVDQNLERRADGCGGGSVERVPIVRIGDRPHLASLI